MVRGMQLIPLVFIPLDFAIGRRVSGCPIIGVMMFSFRMAATVAVVMKRHCRRIREQIARQYQPCQRFPGRTHYKNLDSVKYRRIPSPTSLKAPALDCKPILERRFKRQLLCFCIRIVSKPGRTVNKSLPENRVRGNNRAAFQL